MHFIASQKHDFIRTKFYDLFFKTQWKISIFETALKKEEPATSASTSPSKHFIENAKIAEFEIT